MNDTIRPDARLLGVRTEPCGAHPGRTDQAHLSSLAELAGLPRRRVGEVLEPLLSGRKLRIVVAIAEGMDHAPQDPERD